MLASYVKNINHCLLSKYCANLMKSPSLSISTTKTLSKDEKKPTDDFILSEDLPPIPPNYGFPGDENIKSIYELKKIKSSFQYGNPPKIRRRYIKGPQVIRLMPITNCSNRRFFRIAVTHENCDLSDGFIEDLGSIDPMPNRDNKILVALNVERIKYYLSKSTPLKGKVGEYLGLAGLLPVHPNSYLISYRNRQKLETQSKQTEQAQN